MEKTGKMEKTAAEDAVKLLKDILEIPSVIGKDDEGAVAEYLDQYFKSYGLHIAIILLLFFKFKSALCFF